MYNASFCYFYKDATGNLEEHTKAVIVKRKAGGSAYIAMQQ